MKFGEATGHYRRLAGEYVLGYGLLELQIPDQTDAVRRVRLVFGSGVGGHQQFRILGAPVETGYDAVLGPFVILKVSVQTQRVAVLIFTV